jgi:ABC-2 type transport system ATP-binding protein
MPAIELDSVTKRYRDTTALHDLDLRVGESEIYGFLGPNGAGKSTTINILLDFARPNEGNVRVLGYDAHRESKQIRQHTGVLPEGANVYDRLSGRQHIEFAIDSMGSDEDPEAVAERVGISDALGRKAGDYSKGMEQRLVLGMALVGEPDLLILDEPTTGLDPSGAREIRGIIREEANRGAAVFFSSHILGQVDAVCDRVGILREGELVAEDTVDDLRDEIGTESSLVIDVDRVPEGLSDALRALSSVSTVTIENTTITVSCPDDAKTSVLTTIENEGATINDFSTKEASLEDLFVAYTSDGQDTNERANAEVNA